MRHLRRPAVAVALAGGLLAGCSGTPAHTPAATRAVKRLTGAPRGVVVLRGHRLVVLARLTGTSMTPVGATATPPGTTAGPSSNGLQDAAFTVPETAPDTAAPVQPLAGLRQLSARLVAGIRPDGTLVAFDPARPAVLRPVAPALDWFPDRAGTGAWAVTRPNQPPGACPTVPGAGPGAQVPRYRLEHRALADGHVERTPFLLPCGMRPVADTAAGLVVETLRPHTRATTDVQLVDPSTFRVRRQLARAAAVFDASGGTVLVSALDCRTGPCERLLATGTGFRPRLADLPGGGVLAGAGELDATGRLFAAASYTPDHGGRLTLVVCDLRTGAVTDLGAYHPATPGAAGRLQTDMPSLWSGTRFLYADPATGALTSFAPSGGRREVREGVVGGGTFQVWGASG